MTILATLFGTTLSVSANPNDRNQAALQLIQPREVQDLVKVVPNGQLQRGHSSGAGVTNNLRSLFNQKTLQYIPDPVRDIWRSPRATRLNRGGDCEDLAILAVSMLRFSTNQCAMAIGALWSPPTRSWVGHAWAEGIDEHGRFMIEATSPAIHRLAYAHPWNYRLDYYVGIANKPLAP